MLNINIDTREFSQAMLGVHRDTGFLVEFIVADTMALWSKDLMRSTLPTSKLVSDVGNDRKVGMEAVRKDIAKIFEPVREDAILQKWAADTDAGAIIYRKTRRGTMKIDRDMLRMSMRGFHSAHRNRITGRTWIKPIRDQAWSGKMPVRERDFDQYVRSVQADVGKTKSGWIPSCIYFAAKTGGRVKPIPVGYGWVTKHDGFGSANGDATQVTNRSTLSSRGEAINSVPWIRDSGGMMESTKRTRLADLNGPYYRLRLQKVLDKYQAAA